MNAPLTEVTVWYLVPELTGVRVTLIFFMSSGLGLACVTRGGPPFPSTVPVTVPFSDWLWPQAETPSTMAPTMSIRGSAGR